MVEGVVCGCLDFELVASSEESALRYWATSKVGCIHSLRFMLGAASITLYPPHKQEILHYLVLQATLSGGMLEKFQRVLHFLGLIVGRAAFAKSQTETVAQCIASRLGELNRA